MLWNIEIYQTEGGRTPVTEFLNSLPIKHKSKAQFVIDLLAEYGPLLKEPFTKHLTGTKLKELRIQASPNIYRIFYFAHIEKKFVLLHAFTKKTEQTLRKEIEIAENRMKDYIRRQKNE